MTNRNKIILIKNILLDKDRKSILQISKDLTELKKKNSYKEMRYYFVTLMYKNDAGNIHKYVNDTVLLRIVNFNTSHANWQLIDNKIIFSDKMSELPGIAPLYLGKIEKGFIYDNKGQRSPLNHKTDLTPILKNLIQSHKVVFVKKASSFGGKDVFRFNETFVFDFEKINLQEDYLIQKGLIQHDALNEINPHCVNTLRVITLNRNGKINISSCHLKMGVDGLHNDNVATGGIFINYDIEKNKLSEIATRYVNQLGTSYYSHPETHFIFKDQTLPYPEKVVSLVTKAAKMFPDRYVIGWDVAYTPEGPVIIEGNTNPCTLEIQIALRGLRNNKVYDSIYREFYN